MRIIDAGYKIVNPGELTEKTRDDIYQIIERAGRTCYKSEKNITPESAAKFVQKLVENRHEAMLEHGSMTVIFTVDRGVSHELVRHRMASFAQESTRYCNYSKDKFGKEITVINPIFFRPEEKDVLRNKEHDFLQSGLNASDETKKYVHWYNSCLIAERRYFDLLELGATPQEARTILPNSLKTEVVMTANFREWRHFFKLRAAGETGAPHPQMSEVAVPLFKEVKNWMPEMFSDIYLP